MLNSQPIKLADISEFEKGISKLFFLYEYKGKNRKEAKSKNGEIVNFPDWKKAFSSDYKKELIEKNANIGKAILPIILNILFNRR